MLDGAVGAAETAGWGRLRRADRPLKRAHGETREAEAAVALPADTGTHGNERELGPTSKRCVSRCPRYGERAPYTTLGALVGAQQGPAAPSLSNRFVVLDGQRPIGHHAVENRASARTE